MREILFRGKPKNKSDLILVSQMKPENVLDDFVLGLLMIKDDRYFICISTMGVSNGSLINNCISSVVEVIPETVGQYTVLTDKNGKKIFEGDIIRFDENLYTVQRECDTPGGYWAETGYILKHIGWSDYTSFTSTIDDWENECQVFIIGNIHNNPELLK